jgi:hypothetical protein
MVEGDDEYAMYCPDDMTTGRGEANGIEHRMGQTTTLGLGMIDG